jgi:hypothetical protein
MKNIFLRGNNMNELYISDCWIYFETKEKTYDKAMDKFLKRCVDAGIDINIGRACLRDENGDEIDE